MEQLNFECRNRGTKLEFWLISSPTNFHWYFIHTLVTTIVSVSGLICRFLGELSICGHNKRGMILVDKMKWSGVRKVFNDWKKGQIGHKSSFSSFFKVRFSSHSSAATIFAVDSAPAGATQRDNQHRQKMSGLYRRTIPWFPYDPNHLSFQSSLLHPV